jgi:CPA2 family monovalent cation:H+ antiporter-2
MLRAAGAEHADVLVLAVDDIDLGARCRDGASPLPGWVLTRARSRQHAFRLETGVDEIWRETFASSQSPKPLWWHSARPGRRRRSR